MSDSRINGIDSEGLLYELLTKSLKTDAAMDNLLLWCGNDNFDIRKSGDKIILDLKITKPMNRLEIENLIGHVNLLGWIVTAQLECDGWKNFKEDKFLNNQRKISALQLEAKYPQEQNKSEYEHLYHVSPSIVRTKIEKYGVCPKNKEKIANHPNRVYFVFDKSKIKKIATALNKATKQNLPYDVWELDNKSFIKYNPDARFLRDVNYAGGVFTLSNIPPKFLKLVDTIQLTDGKIKNI